MIDPRNLDTLLHPQFDAAALKAATPLGKGLGASPGAACGKVVFTADDAESWAERGEKVVLVRLETSPEDITGMKAAQGILTVRGGMTSHAAVVKWAANYVAAKIKAANPTAEKPFVLGLPTGSSPLGMYKNLIELNKQGVVSFQNVITFNMDEYVGLPKDHPESYHSFMWNNFFSHIDIKPENVNILNGNAEDLEAECASYEARMKAVGGSA